MHVRAIVCARRDLVRKLCFQTQPGLRRNAARWSMLLEESFREVSAYSTADRERGRVAATACAPSHRRPPKMVSDEMSWWLS
jgi:hypothetical protein